MLLGFRASKDDAVIVEAIERLGSGGGIESGEWQGAVLVEWQ